MSARDASRREIKGHFVVLHGSLDTAHGMANDMNEATGCQGIYKIIVLCPETAIVENLVDVNNKKEVIGHSTGIFSQDSHDSYIKNRIGLSEIILLPL